MQWNDCGIYAKINTAKTWVVLITLTLYFIKINFRKVNLSRHTIITESRCSNTKRSDTASAENARAARVGKRPYNKEGHHKDDLLMKKVDRGGEYPEQSATAANGITRYLNQVEIVANATTSARTEITSITRPEPPPCQK